MLTNPPVPFDFCLADPISRDCTTGCGTDGALHSTNCDTGHWHWHDGTGMRWEKFLLLLNVTIVASYCVTEPSQ